MVAKNKIYGNYRKKTRSLKVKNYNFEKLDICIYIGVNSNQRADWIIEINSRIQKVVKHTMLY